MTSVNVRSRGGDVNDVDTRWRFLYIGRMAKTKHIGVRFDQAAREALERAARVDDRSMAALIRKVIEEWLRKNGHLKDG